MKILVLNGSPTPNGNTVAMIQAFAEGAKCAGHEVQVMDVACMQISGCHGDASCRKTGNGCALQDDMQKVYPAVREAEAIIFASPIYYYTFTAQLHAAMQRFFAFGKLPWIKKMGALLSSASPNVYDACEVQFAHVSALLGIENAGMVTAFGAENKSEAKMNEVKEFAKKF